MNDCLWIMLGQIFHPFEGVYVTIGKPSFCLFLYFTGVHFLGELQHGSDVGQQKIKCRPIRIREIGDVSLSDVLYELFEECKTDVLINVSHHS